MNCSLLPINNKLFNLEAHLNFIDSVFNDLNQTAVQGKMYAEIGFEMCRDQYILQVKVKMICKGFLIIKL